MSTSESPAASVKESNYLYSCQNKSICLLIEKSFLFCPRSHKEPPGNKFESKDRRSSTNPFFLGFLSDRPDAAAIVAIVAAKTGDVEEVVPRRHDRPVFEGIIIPRFFSFFTLF